MPRYLVCLTGASGAIYGLRLLKALAATEAELHLVASAWGERVVLEETGRPLSAWLEELGGAAPGPCAAPAGTPGAAPGAAEAHKCRITRHSTDDLAAPVASGSFRLDGTAVVPCSMGTAGALASGLVQNLVHRAGAVALKEGWPLVLAPRESPLSLVDLRNLSALAEAGAAIMPASPGFYHRPATIEELVDGFVARILDRLGAPNPLRRPWQGPATNQGDLP
ncbi:MAG TPA: UbiX family flavin prenyltransferase [Spirochaetia bacterium]|nr:UbiX family flavin prenyltransferase [Spirochaetales bacterium]HRY72633.1 UbiX family flavin prenyltransferase [Spirochaetia bacterium]